MIIAASLMRVGFEVLPREFFARSALQVAPDLLGCVLSHETAAGQVTVVITEVEAYAGLVDPASHAFRGQTARNAVMFGPPGHAYVYFTYGMHFCVNLVCEPAGHASAVLLRAGRVAEGAALAATRRAVTRRAASGAAASSQASVRPAVERDLARGPARLCQALAIDRGQDGLDVCGGSPLVAGRPADWTEPGPGGISTGPRVGISQAQDWPWRFWLTGDRHVSSYKEARPRGYRAKRVPTDDGRDGTMQR